MTIELEHHLVHDRLRAAYLDAEIRASAGDQADEIEGVFLAELFLLDQLAQQLKLRLLSEGGGTVEAEKCLGMRGIEAHGAHGWRAAARLERHALGVVPGLPGLVVCGLPRPDGGLA